MKMRMLVPIAVVIAFALSLVAVFGASQPSTVSHQATAPKPPKPPIAYVETTNWVNYGQAERAFAGDHSIRVIGPQYMLSPALPTSQPLLVILVGWGRVAMQRHVGASRFVEPRATFISLQLPANVYWTWPEGIRLYLAWTMEGFGVKGSIPAGYLSHGKPVSSGLGYTPAVIAPQSDWSAVREAIGHHVTVITSAQALSNVPHWSIPGPPPPSVVVIVGYSPQESMRTVLAVRPRVGDVPILVVMPPPDSSSAAVARVTKAVLRGYHFPVDTP